MLYNTYTGNDITLKKLKRKLPEGKIPILAKVVGI